ncbi:MAG: sugar phosphate isomerase/epimerase [Atopostipes suicloacalis]|nr:sugar phosphate isomerase/epimerase [Atopostipes suicloacalis]
MVKLGVCSVTFRNLSVEDLIREVKRAGLKAIEWGSDIHVPPNNKKRAREVVRIMDEAGLETSSYGSYYRVGIENEYSFEEVLETAVILKAKDIRVWAGRKGSSDVDDAYFNKVVRDSQRIAGLAAKENIRVSYEYHRKTLTDTVESTLKLLGTVNDENIKLYWQPSIGLDKESRLQNIKEIGQYITNVHVFKWEQTNRLSLKEGIHEWIEYSNMINRHSKNSKEPYYLLEFVKNDSLNQFYQDAEALKEIILQSKMNKNIN